MAQYKSFEPNIESGGSELTAIAFGAVGDLKKNELVNKYSLNTSPGAWNDLQSLLSALQEISASLGEMNLFLIGKGATEKANFPPMEGLKNALESIDVAYHMNHRKNGKVMFDQNTGQMTEGIGHYKVTKFDEGAKTAEIVCHTPYPSKLEEGIITQIVRMFKPAGSLLPQVILDESKETKRKGGESCTYRITW